MSDVYNELLDATIQHLQELKAQGVRFVPVTAEALAALSQSPRVAPKNISAPAPVAPSTPRPIAAPSPVIPKPVEIKPAPTPALSLDISTGPQPSALPAFSPAAKTAAFAELRQRASVCVKCPNLAASRQNVVFGVGSIDAQLMFVGEAPGADEDQQGEPFVGKAGQLLTKIIQTMGLQRGDVYIANILKCRPDTPGETSGNRKPTPEEMNTCIPYLHEQIDLIRPAKSSSPLAQPPSKASSAKPSASPNCAATGKPTAAFLSCRPIIPRISCATRPSAKNAASGKTCCKSWKNSAMPISETGKNPLPQSPPRNEKMVG